MSTMFWAYFQPPEMVDAGRELMCQLVAEDEAAALDMLSAIGMAGAGILASHGPIDDPVSLVDDLTPIEIDAPEVPPEGWE